MILACGFLLLVFFSFFGIAWYFSEQMAESRHPPAVYPETVTNVRMAQSGNVIVSLEATHASAQTGTYGLIWDGGSALLDPLFPRIASKSIGGSSLGRIR